MVAKGRISASWWLIPTIKQINDGAGHLIAMTVRIWRHVTELVCWRIQRASVRYGGEESVVLMPDVDGNRNARSKANQIRAAIASSPCSPNGVPIPMTISVGAAHMPLPAIIAAMDSRASR